MRNVKARRALSLAINRDQFTNKIMDDGSLVPEGFVPEKLTSYRGQDFSNTTISSVKVTQNIKKAKKLWAEALKESNQKKYSLTLTADDTVAGKNATEFIQSQWSKLPGLNVTNSNVPYKTTLSKAANGQFNAIIMSWSADFPDPIAFLQLFTTGNSYNEGRWSSNKYDTLIKSASEKNANNPKKRWQDLVDSQQVLLKEQGIIPFYQQGKPQLVREKVRGIVYFPVGANFDFSKAYISKN